MNPIHKLTEQLSKLPGIGPRQAKRTVYHLLTQRPEFLKELSNAIATIQDEIATCTSCMRFYEKGRGSAASDLCSICGDPNRDKSVLCVVARDVDLDNIERTRSYDGLYFVLGGAIPILEKEPGKAIREREFLSSVDRRSKDGTLKEVIFAMNANPEGENTYSYLSTRLKPLADERGLALSILGRGLSTGSELEYSDADTLRNALANRR